MVFSGVLPRRLLIDTPHVFDPSYSTQGRCVCGLAREADVHATVLRRGASEQTDGRRGSCS